MERLNVLSRTRVIHQNLKTAADGGTIRSQKGPAQAGEAQQLLRPLRLLFSRVLLFFSALNSSSG